MQSISWFRSLGFLLCLIAASGCASGGAANPERDPLGVVPTALHVRNDNWHDMKIYLVPEHGGRPVRVGTVTGLSTSVIRMSGAMNEWVLRGARFLLRPLGSRDAYLTPHVNVGPGDRLQLNVANQLALSTVVRR